MTAFFETLFPALTAFGIGVLIGRLLWVTPYRRRPGKWKR